MVGPAPLGRRGRLEAGDSVLPDVLQEIGRPVDAGLDAARVVGRGRAALGTGRHQEVGEAVDHHAEVTRAGVPPLVPQRLAIGAADVDVIEGAGDGVEAGGIDDDVELVVALRGAQPARRHACQRRLPEIDQVDVGPIVGLVVPGLERHALHAEAVVPGDQRLGRLRVLDPSPDAPGDVFGEFGVRHLVGEDLAEVRKPDAEARRVVELVPELQPLLAAHLVEAAPVGFVLEAAGRARAGGEDLVVAPADVGHLLVRDQAVVERAAPVGPALEHRQIANLVGDFADHLDRGRAGADHRHLLARKIDRFLRPVIGVERPALEGIHALEPGQGRLGEQAQHHADEAAGHLARGAGLLVAHSEAPQPIVLVPVGGDDPAVELHVLAQAELVGDVIEVAQVLGLAGKALLPVPLVEQLAREGVAVGIALRIEARAGIAVPVPGAAEIRGELQDRGLHAEVGQPLDLVDAADAGADDDDFVVQHVTHSPSSRPKPSEA